MKTKHVSHKDITRSWYLVDAESLILGRVSARVAQILSGKNKANYSPNLDCGDFVVIVNAEKIAVTGDKELSKKYWHYTGFPGGERQITLGRQRIENPERILYHAVKGMLPKGPLGRKIVQKLKVYKGAEHPHAAQSPAKISLA